MKTKRILAGFLTLAMLASVSDFSSIMSFAEEPAAEDAPVADQSSEGSDISPSVIDSDGNTTVNGEYVLIVNHSTTTAQRTGDISSLYQYQDSTKSGESIDSGVDPSGSYPIDFTPELGEIIAEPDLKIPTERATYSVGSTKTFQVMPDRSSTGTYTYSDFHAKVMAVGTHCVIWAHNGTTIDSFYADNAGSYNITTAQAQALAAEFDNKYSGMQTNFGSHYDADNSGKVSLLVYDIPDGYSGSGGYIAGYYFSADLVNIYSNSTGNLMPMVHIDTYPSMGTASSNYNVSRAYSTMVHEYQHMINFSYGYSTGRSPYSQDTFINEMLSMAAEDLFYDDIKQLRLSSTYNGSYAQYIANGHSLTNWNSSNVLPNYSLSYLFGQYLVAQTGGYSIFSRIVTSPYTDTQAITASLTTGTSRLRGMSFRNIHMNFRAALALQEASGISSFSGSSILPSDTIKKNYYRLTSPSYATLEPGASILLYNPSGTATLSMTGKGADVLYYGLSVNNAVAPAAPVAVGSSINAVAGVAYSGTVTATDVNGDALTYAAVAQPSHGTLTLHANGSYTYTANAGYTGSDSFTFKANDGTADSNTATVSVTVVEVEVSLSGADIKVTPGEKTAVAAVVTNSSDTSVIWTVTGNNGYATTSVSGGKLSITGVSEGSFTITAASSAYRSKTVSTTVRVLDGAGEVARVLAIGSGDYPYTANDLSPGPENDAQTFAKTMDKMNIADNHLTVLNNSVSTKAALQSAITTAFAGADDNDTSYFFYSGHGSTGGNLYLPGGPISPAELAAMFAKVKGTVVLVIDCCFSGGIIGKSAGTDDLAEAFGDDFIAGVQATDEAQAKGVFTSSRFKVLTASSQVQVSWQNSLYGYFTSAFAMGLGTDYGTGAPSYREVAADTDRNGTVTLTELYRFIEQTNLDSAVRAFPENDSFAFLSYDTQAYAAPNLTVSNAYAQNTVNATVELNIRGTSSVTVALFERDYTSAPLFDCYNKSLTGYEKAITYTNLGAGGNTLTFALPANLSSTSDYYFRVFTENDDFVRIVPIRLPVDSGTGTTSVLLNTALSSSGQFTGGVKTASFITSPSTNNEQKITVNYSPNSYVYSNAMMDCWLLNAQGDIVRTLAMKNWGKETYNSINGYYTYYNDYYWDGRGDDGRYLPDGTYTVYAKVYYPSGFTVEDTTCKIKLTAYTLSSLTLNTSAATLSTPSSLAGVTPTYPAGVSLTPAFNDDAATTAVTWSTSNAAVATVDASGAVTAKGKGTAIITATSVGKADGGKSLTAKCTVTVKQTATGVTVAAISIKKTDAGKKPVATVLPSTADYKTGTWESLDASIVTIDANTGVLIPVKGGVASVRFTTTEGVSGTGTVTVISPVTDVTLSEPPAEVNKGDIFTLMPTIAPEDANNKNVTWKSSSTAIASVSADGTVTALSAGTVTITVTTADQKKTAFATFTVLAPATGISLNSTSETIDKYKSFQLTATIAPTDATDKTVSWSVTDLDGEGVGDVVTVSAAGKVTATALNATVKDVIVWAQTHNGKKAGCVFHVNVPVEGVSISGDSIASSKLTVTTIEGNQDLTEVIAPSNADNQAVTWASSNTAVATVDENGVLHPVAKGVVTVTVTTVDMKKTSKLAVTVIEPVASVTLDREELELSKGKSLTLKADVQSITASNRSVVWSIDASGGEVSGVTVASGKVTASTAATLTGEVYIVATAADSSGKSDRCKLTLAAPVTALAYNEPAATLYLNGTEAERAITYTLSATTASGSGGYASDKVIWASSNTKVATVDITGKVTAVAKGTATITATTTDGSAKSAKVIVSVKRLVEGITLSADTLNIAVSKGVTLIATVTPADADLKTITWTSSNANITVSNGRVTVKTTATANETATITAAVNDASGKSATAVITATALGKTVAVSGSDSVLIGETTDFTAVVHNISGATDHISQQVKWASSNVKVATVDEAGTVTAVGKGTATITATATDGSALKGTKAVTVVVPVTGVALNKSVAYIAPKKSETLKATVAPATASNVKVTWSIAPGSDADITVSATGAVSVAAAATVGETATVVATTAHGSFTAACVVHVVASNVTSVKLDKTTYDFTGIGSTYTLTPTVLPATATNKALVWASSNADVATVDEDGAVTSTGYGSAKITATTVDGAKLAACTVTVYPIVKTDRLTAEATLRYLEIDAAGADATTTYNSVIKNQLGNVMNAELFSYASSKPAVATVDENGKVTAAGGAVSGSTTITATLIGDLAKRKVTYTVTLVPKQVKTLDISYRLPKTDGTGASTYKNADLSLLYTSGQRVELTVQQIASDGSLVTARPKWTSGNTAVLTVSTLANGNAVITVKKPGTATVTVQASDKFGTTNSITVHVYDFTPSTADIITVNKKSIPDAFGYISNAFDIGTQNDTEITGIEVDTVKLGSTYLHNGSFVVEEIGGRYVAKAKGTLATGTYTLSADVTVADGESGGLLALVSGMGSAVKRITLSVKVVDVAPNVTVTIPKVNLFYINDRYPITLASGGIAITDVALENTTAPSFTQNFALEEDGGVWYITRTGNDYVAAGNKGNLVVTLQGYADPIRKPVTISASTTAPKLTATGMAYTAATQSASFTVTNSTAGAQLTGFTASLNAAYAANAAFTVSVDEDTVTVGFKDGVTPVAGQTYTARLLIGKDEWNATALLTVTLRVTA